jgi:hypothetical protein
VSKRFLFWWAVWIGVLSGIYCAIYSLIPFPNQNLIWISFVALPIYFNGGAKREEFPNYVASMIMGIIWAVVYLYGIGLLIKAGVSVPMTMMLDVGIMTIVVCAIHFTIAAKTWLNNVPIIFGALAVTFSQGGKDLLTIGCTMFGGILLALCCQEGLQVLEKWGISPSGK